MKKNIKVAFQGEKGAYSHLACLEVFPKAEPVACSTFEEAFLMAKDNSDFKIIIPIGKTIIINGDVLIPIRKNIICANEKIISRSITTCFA